MIPSTRRRVLVWTSSLLPGSETFIRSQSDALTRWQRRLAGVYRHESPLTRDDDYVLYAGGPISVLLRRVFLKTGVSTRAIRLLRQWRPDLVHAHFLPNAWSIARAARISHIPLIVTVHGFDVTTWATKPGFWGWRSRRKARVALNQAALVIAVSGHIREKVLALGADPTKVVVHHIGISIPPAPAHRGEADWDVAFVGRFVPKKGVLDLIDALGVVARTRSVSAVFIGDGPLMPDALEHAASTNADITFLGAQAPEQVRAVLERSRVFAAPSKTAPDGDSEGFGMVFLEAAAASLPVVSTLHGGIPEAVDDGATGLLSPEGDVSALAENILSLLSAPDRRARMGELGRRRVEERFDIVTQTALLEDIYDRVIAQTRRTQ